jgi:hypothetical protein
MLPGRGVDAHDPLVALLEDGRLDGRLPTDVDSELSGSSELDTSLIHRQLWAEVSSRKTR